MSVAFARWTDVEPMIGDEAPRFFERYADFPRRIADAKFEIPLAYVEAASFTRNPLGWRDAADLKVDLKAFTRTEYRQLRRCADERQLRAAVAAPVAEEKPTRKAR